MTLLEPDEWSAEAVQESGVQGDKYQGFFGDRDVLIIRASESLEGPDIVPRKEGTLTAEDKDRLTSQGIPEECWGDDAQLMEARYRRSGQKYYVLPMECGDGLTRQIVMDRIREAMKNTDRPGVLVHYIGPGKKDTGDWCFDDGFITFEDLADAYINQEFSEPKCLEITSDCSYSGKWVSKCREFLNGAGVQPCGHSAMEKNILLKVKTSCRSHQIPHTLLYSARGWRNDEDTGYLFQEYGGYKVEHDQHLRYLDNTMVRCKPDVGFDKPCDHIYDWHKRIYLVRSNIEGRNTWQFVMVEDEDAFLKNIAKHRCLIIKSGDGQDPPEDVHAEMKQWHKIVRKPRSRHQSMSDFPGVVFLDDPVSQRITSEGATIQSPHAGISLSIPKQALSSTEPDIDVLIHPCLDGPFELPAEYEPTSPTYLIQPDRKVKLQRDATLQIHHYTRLQSEDDCKEMAFFSASSTPEYQQSGPVYVFKEMKPQGVFTPDSQIGEIKLQHFCFATTAKVSPSIELASYTVLNFILPGNNNYSIRLYRATSPEVSALFCMCPNHPQYIKLCEERISDQYRAMSWKDEHRSVRLAQMNSEEVKLSVQNSKGWNVTFDATPAVIRKEEVDLSKHRATKFADYPPRCFITAYPETAVEKSATPELRVQGLHKELTFPVIMGPTLVQMSRYAKYTAHISAKISISGVQILSIFTETSHSPPPNFKGKVLPTPSELETPPQPPQCWNSLFGCQTQPSYFGRSPLNLSAELQNVLLELTSLNREWVFLAIVLGIGYQEIETNHRNSVERCKEELITTWLNNSSEASWEELCDALKSDLVKRHDLADKIKNKYC